MARSSAPAADDAASFLAALFPDDIPAEARLLIWTLPEKRSHYASTVAEALAIVASLRDGDLDVYVGPGLAPPGKRASQRAKNDEVLGVPGLWVDLDFQSGTAHKKQNLPTEDEAREFIVGLTALGAQPSIIVRSGHGFQLWWLWEHVVMFTTAEGRALGSAAQQEWVYGVRELARTRGWDVDATIDLARVMRMPSTFNHKSDPPIQCVIVEQSPVRYTPETLPRLGGLTPASAAAKPGKGAGTRQTLPSAAVPPADAAVGSLKEAAQGRANATKRAGVPGGSVGRVVLRVDASPPFDKWIALQEADVKVQRTWKRNRKDFKDTSPSAYDMALASFTVRAGWSDQEIADLLIAHRRFHVDDLKLREDYYERTIARARATVDVEHLDEELNDINSGNGDDGNGDDVYAGLSRAFGIEIVKLVKYLGDPPTYVLVLRVKGEERSITLGAVDGILNFRQFRAHVAAAVDVVIPTCSPATWDKRAQSLLRFVTVEELGAYSTAAGVAEAWVNEYLSAYRPSDDVETAVIAGRPFVDAERHVCIALRSMSFWLHTVQGERVSPRDLSRYMRMAGWEQRAQHVTAAEGRAATTRSVWRSPMTM